jgi:alpha-beta hydrolase superfamily lysophospholipase
MSRPPVDIVGSAIPPPTRHVAGTGRQAGIKVFRAAPPSGYGASVETQTDVLGAPYTRRRIELPPDYEGAVEATLVTLRAPAPTQRAVLYLHGFVDYYFQKHLAEFFTARGYDFYALDLRKYGRSILPHQTPNFCFDLAEYYPEIDAALKIIREEDGHDTVLFNGHSTGGLISVLYAQRVRGQGRLQGLFLNSPFLELNVPPAVRTMITPVVALVAKAAPRAKVSNLGTVYGRTIHADYEGEWHYDLAWKPLSGFPVAAAWTTAIRRAQRQAQHGLSIDVPILLASSARGYRGKLSEAAHHADTVLNPADMARYGPGLGKDVTLIQIDGGLHDLTLSAPAVRATLFDEVADWLAAKPGLGVVDQPDATTPTAP